MVGDVICKPLVEVEIFPTRCECGDVEGEREGTDFEEGFEYLENFTINRRTFVRLRSVLLGLEQRQGFG